MRQPSSLQPSIESKRTGHGITRGVRDWVLAAGVAAVSLGVWAFFFPETFYADFPVAGADWVSTLGPHNEHLLRDYGSAQIGLGVSAALVALWRSRQGVICVMAGYVVFGTLHLGYHLGTFGFFTPTSAAAQASALAAFVVVPLGVLISTRNPINKEQRT